MKKPKDVFYIHKNFSELSKKELDLYLDFLAKVMSNLNGFDVWEAENIFSEEDTDKWNRMVIERYTALIEEKNKLENEIYN